MCPKSRFLFKKVPYNFTASHNFYVFASNLVLPSFWENGLFSNFLREKFLPIVKLLEFYFFYILNVMSFFEKVKKSYFLMHQNCWINQKSDFFLEVPFMSKAQNAPRQKGNTFCNCWAWTFFDTCSQKVGQNHTCLVYLTVTS